MTFSPDVIRGRLVVALERAARRESIRGGRRRGAGGVPAQRKVFWSAARVSDFLCRRLGPKAG